MLLTLYYLFGKYSVQLLFAHVLVHELKVNLIVLIPTYLSFGLRL